MNTTDPHEHQARPEPDPPTARTEPVAPDGDAGMAPEAVQAADVDGRTRRELDVDRPARGVDWVRASDLLARGSGAVSRRAIDIDARLARATRHGIAVTARAVGRGSVQAVRRMSPRWGFGRDEDPAVEPRGMGRA